MASGTTSGRAGAVAAATVEGLEVRRLLSAADFDATFGTNGAVAMEVPGPVASVSSSSLVQPDGKVVVATFWASDQSVYRLNADGTYDPTFGVNGRVSYRVAGGYSTILGLQPDGKLLVANQAVREYAAGGGSLPAVDVVRLLPDGTPDPTFGTAGTARVAGLETWDAQVSVSSVGVDAEGRPVVTGLVTERDFATRDVFVARLLPSGATDTSFSDDGVAYVRRTGDDVTAGTFAQPGGRLVVSSSPVNYGGVPTLVRLNTDGTPDPTFGSGGSAPMATKLYHIRSLSQDASGRLLIGNVDDGSGGNRRVYLARYDADGQPDSSFGVGGQSVFDLYPAVTGTPSIGRVAYAPDGSLIVGGGLGSGYVCAKLDADGKALDATFDGDGRVRVLLPGETFGARTHVDPAGRLVLVGSTITPNDAVLMRLTPAGAADPTFGGGVARVTAARSGGDSAGPLVRRPDGKLVVFAAGGGGGAMFRLNPDGTRDPTLGGGTGMVATAGTVGLAAARPDGSVVVGTGNRTEVRAYRPDGTPDPSFGGGDGVVPLNHWGQYNGLATDAAGRVYVWDGSETLYRLTAAGDLDPTFAGDGSFNLPPTATGVGGALAVAADGSSLLVSNGRLFRLTPDGAADPAFNGGAPRGVGQAYAVAIDPAGGALVATGGSTAIGVTRYGPDGAPDPAYGAAGTRLVPAAAAASGYYERPTGIAVHPDGGAVVTVAVDVPTGYYYVGSAIVGLTPRGDPDEAIGPGGARSLSPGGIAGYGLLYMDRGVLVDDAGRILLTASADAVGRSRGDADALVLRLEGRATPPAAAAGGPYPVPEGGAVILTGTATPSAGRTIVATEWDTDYDGTTFRPRAAGTTATFDAAGIDGAATRTVAFRTRDDLGRWGAVATAAVAVANVAPTASFAAGPAVTLGQPSTVGFDAASDPSPADLAALRYSFDFDNDGDFADPGDVAGSASPSAAFTFPAAGTYPVVGRVADDDGGYTDYTTTVVVNPPPPPPPPAPLPVDSTRDLRAAADAYAADGTKASTNFGTAAELQVRKSSTAGNSRESYLRFDLTAGPAYSSLESAALRVFAKASAAGSVALDLYAVAGTGWSETGLTWNARPAVGTKLASKTVSSTTAAWVEFDVSAYVKAQKAAGATKVAFALRSPTATTPYVTFPSDEAAANRPALRLGERVSPAVVFSAAAVTVPEAKTAAASVRLTVAPLGPVTVTVARTGGDGDLSASPAALAFTPANWATPQPVTFAAAADADATNGAATFSATADGYASKSLTATEADDDVPKVLRASADGYVRDGTYAGTNYGQAASMQVRKSTTAGNTRWAVLKFDLTAVTTVSSAVLRLFGKLDSTTNPSVAVQAFAASTATWTEGGVTWSNKPTPAGAALGQATVAGTTAKWYAIDLTAWLAAQKAAGKTSVALVLTAPVASTSAVLFNSDEATASRPELVVTP